MKRFTLLLAGTTQLKNHEGGGDASSPQGEHDAHVASSCRTEWLVGVQQLQHACSILVTLSMVLCTTLCAGGSTKVSSRQEISATPTNKPTVVYVADFDLDAADIRSEKGLLPSPPKLPGPLGNMSPPLPGAPKDPQKLARQLVDEMSESLVKKLTKAGLNARRLAPGAPIPTSGWLVRGVFTNVNQGNQLERAVVGFGKGKTDLQVLVDIADLAQSAPAQFHEVKTPASITSKAPGAAPMIERHPAAVAVKFALAGKDLDKNIKQTAAQIAEEVRKRAGNDHRPRQ